MTTTKWILACVIAIAVGTGLGYWLVPVKVVEKTKIVEKEVVRWKRNVDTTTTTTEKPDGTVTTVVVDKSKEEGTSDRNTVTDKSKVVTKENKDWLVGGGVALDLDGRKSFEGWISRRILGEVYIGVFGSSEGRGGIGLSLRF